MSDKLQFVVQLQKHSTRDDSEPRASLVLQLERQTKVYRTFSWLGAPRHATALQKRKRRVDISTRPMELCYLRASTLLPDSLAPSNVTYGVQQHWHAERLSALPYR